MLANVKSSTLMGLSVFEIEIEVDAAGGIPAWEKVGVRQPDYVHYFYINYSKPNEKLKDMGSLSQSSKMNIYNT